MSGSGIKLGVSAVGVAAVVVFISVLGTWSGSCSKFVLFVLTSWMFADVKLLQELNGWLELFSIG